MLDPDVVLNFDAGGDPSRAQDPTVGAEAVARNLLAGARPFAPFGWPALVNGGAGVIVAPRERTIAVVGFTITGDRIAEIDLITDPAKLRGVRRRSR